MRGVEFVHRGDPPARGVHEGPRDGVLAVGLGPKLVRHLANQVMGVSLDPAVVAPAVGTS